jgi:NitT/TauT family transport system substrate-binding protein
VTGLGSTRPRLPTVLCALLVVLCVCAATSSASATTAADRTRSLTTINIVTPPIVGAAHVFYAKHRDFFRRQGLDAKITILLDPTHLLPAVLSGEAHFASASMGGLAIAKSKNVPVRLVASGLLYRPLAPTTALVARKGLRIRGARGLIGKKVAIESPNQIPHVAIRRWLGRNGVSEARIEFRTISFPQMLAPLARGEVDAAVLPEPYLTLALQQGATRVANVFTTVCPRICLVSGWMARNDADPTVTAKFRNAIQAASVWANQEKNRPAADAILSKYTPINAAVMRRMTRAYYAQRLVPRLAQPWVDAYAALGIIPKSFPAIELVK